MSDSRSIDASPAMPAMLAGGLMAAFLLVAIGPTLIADQLVRAQWVLQPHNDVAHVELSMGAFGLTALVIGGLGLLLRPVPWLPLRLRLVVGSYVPLFVVWTVFLIVYLRAMHAMGHGVSPQFGLLYFSKHGPTSWGFLVVALATTLGAPLAEEVLFRGYLQTLLRVWLGPRVTIPLVGILFGLMHGLEYALPITLLGIYFAWLRERSGSLLPSMLAHALHNGIAVLVTTCWPQTLVWMYPQ